MLNDSEMKVLVLGTKKTPVSRDYRAYFCIGAARLHKAFVKWPGVQALLEYLSYLESLKMLEMP